MGNDGKIKQHCDRSLQQVSVEAGSVGRFGLVMRQRESIEDEGEDVWLDLDVAEDLLVRLAQAVKSERDRFLQEALTGWCTTCSNVRIVKVVNRLGNDENVSCPDCADALKVAKRTIRAGTIEP